MTEPDAPSAPWRLVTLGPRDADRYCDHLLRLNGEDRRFRFFENPPEYVIALHAGAAATDGRLVVACEIEGALRGAAELIADAERPGLAEMAFSIEHDWRKRGIGAALVQEMIAAGKSRGFARLELEILPDNVAMQALARHFTAKFETRDGNIFAIVELAADSA